MGRKGSSGRGKQGGSKLLKFTICLYKTVRGCFKTRQWRGKDGEKQAEEKQSPFLTAGPT